MMLAMNRSTSSAATFRRRCVDPTAVLIWLFASGITTFFALLLQDSAWIDGLYIPRTNDSLYHAHRILDAVAGPSGFYEFDERLHAPDGAWITWPWAYDFLLAQIAAATVWFDPTLHPLAIVFYLPVAWILITAALLLGICRRIGLSAEMQFLAMLAFALSPLTQLLHSVGMLDHHYVEQTFVLASVWLGIRWLQRPEHATTACALGVALGMAPAFHNGLFILQLLPLSALAVLWLRGVRIPPRSAVTFAITLLVVTQLVLLPSKAYREGMFEFGLLSWFHLYIATCTAVIVLYCSRFAHHWRSTFGLVGICALLLIPIGSQMVGGAGFLSGSFSILEQIVEVQSPYELWTSGVYGPAITLSYYSYLLLLTPMIIPALAYRLLHERVPDRLYYVIASLFGLVLLLNQFRLHYFGLFALLTAPFLAVDLVRSRFGWHRGAVFVAMFALVAVAYQPALRERLFVIHAPGSASDYATMLPLYLTLAPLCEEDPGVVLASSDDGNALLYHTGCSVIANNFILRRADGEHINEIIRLFQLPPEEIIKQRPDIKYMLLRVRDFLEPVENTLQLSRSNPVAAQLLVYTPKPPPNLELVKTVTLKVGPESEEGVVARLYRVNSDDQPPTANHPSLLPATVTGGVPGSLR